ncbi:MAG: 4-hydroxythreonine-4-phosphate dehydrogenase PdxA [Myxococcales bacterium]|nr:4-hydroxythreonine-4-phosphate dehydrogenase PdxA [Myxococcales bacterium]
MSTLAVSVGCPSGIGPEVSVVAVEALASARPDDQFVLVGDNAAIEAASAVRRVDLRLFRNVRVEPTSDLPEVQRRPGKPNVEAGRSQLAAIDRALALVLARTADALVTGPVAKSVIAATGVPFTGHTEYLAHKTNTNTAVMCFVGPSLRTSLVTTHLALRAVPGAITRDAVVKSIVLTARSLWRDFSVDSPRIGVCGLNPHAGEDGMLGDEDLRVIAPAVEDAREILQGIASVAGPIPAESAYRYGRGFDRYDAIVAMYHDQATIASKLVDFGDAVNVTLGLPIIRTSVDHGTGYDIAYTGSADARGMLAAMRMALSMAAARTSRGERAR